MSQVILKWGNSLGFRIPASMAKQMQIEENTEVELRIEGTRLIIERANDNPRFTSRDLVKALRKTKKELIELGKPRGHEIL